MQQARDAARGHLLTLGAGLFAAGALLFTGRNDGLSRRTLDVSQRTLAMTEQGQVTDRYTRAIEQLGSDRLDVRIGGIYALERIARDSAADRTTIGEVLTAFVRTHAPWPPSLPGQYVATAPIHQVPKLQTRAPDVQACLWVLGRGGFADALGENEWLDLSVVDLRRADLRNARLGAADLRFGGLQRAATPDIPTVSCGFPSPLSSLGSGNRGDVPAAPVMRRAQTAPPGPRPQPGLAAAWCCA